MHTVCDFSSLIFDPKFQIGRFKSFLQRRLYIMLTFFNHITSAYGIPWIIGQILGMIAIILGFISYQLKTQRQLLFMQTAVAVTFCIHFFLIGAYSGMAMNVVGIVRNLVYNKRSQKGSQTKLIPIIFVLIQCVMCLITWEAWYSVFVLFGLAINTYCMSFSNLQSLRKSIFITSPMVLTYDLFAGSIGGAIYESIVIVSSLVGVLRNKNKTRS